MSEVYKNYNIKILKVVNQDVVNVSHSGNYAYPVGTVLVNNAGNYEVYDGSQATVSGVLLEEVSATGKANVMFDGEFVKDKMGIFKVEQLSGDGVTTDFTLSLDANVVVAVKVDGVEVSEYEYTVSGNTLSFNSAPAAGTNNIEIAYLGALSDADLAKLRDAGIFAKDVLRF